MKVDNFQKFNESFQAHPATQTIVESGLVDESGWCFQLTIERSEGADAVGKYSMLPIRNQNAKYREKSL